LQHAADSVQQRVVLGTRQLQMMEASTSALNENEPVG
jgi:hypothetical protein